MAKIKSKKKKNISDLKIEKKQNNKSSINPFEVHINKQKFHVLGRKMKQDRGLPGIARAKSIKKRKETLLQEYKVKDKANKFMDFRIGERNSAMTKEDRILARFTAERLKAHKRKAMFNLGEDEVLTHKGRSLAEIENFEGPSSDEEDNEYGKGKLDANFVEEAHFGGGLLKKTDESKGRAAIIEQLIAESKKRKAEKQEAKEKTLEKTQELDTEWRELMPMVTATNSGEKSTEQVEKRDSYDLLMNQLKFEARGTPSNRLKSESEIAAEEARKLRELEEERLRRMRGEEDEITEKQGKSQHRSADDLDDGFEFDNEEEFQVMYDKEGKLITNFKDNEVKKRKLTSVDEIERSESDGDDENDEEEVDEENVDGGEEVEEDKSEEENAEDSSSDSEGEAVYDLSDLKNVENNVELEDVEENEEENKLEDVEYDKNEKKEEKIKKKVAFNPIVKTLDDEASTNKPKTDEELEKEREERRKLMEEAKSSLPFTFKVPENYDEFFELLNGKNLTEQKIIFERMIKCNHPSLNEKNKESLNRLFAFFLQHINDCDYLDCWNVLDTMAPFLFELTQFSASNAAYCISEVLLEKHNEYLEKKYRYPTTETMVFLKLIPLLFPTSDKRHPITTPAFVFIAEMLFQCHVTNRRSIATGLFLVTLLSQYVSLSKRILPEVVNFLCGILHLATPAKSKGIITPPFQSDHKFLYLNEPYLEITEEDLKMKSSDLSPNSVKIDDSFRIRSIYTTLRLLAIFIELWKDVTYSWLLLSPIVDHISALELNKYPSAISEEINQLKQILSKIEKKGFEPTEKQQKKPKALRLYDPHLVDINKRKYNEEKKLVTKYKREMKGALREIRRDRAFLANVKYKEIAKSDAERIKKVKEIYSWGTQQQGELNKLARKKKRRN